MGRLVWWRQNTLFWPRPLIEDNSVRSKASYPVSARLGYKFEDGLIVRVDGFNLLNQEASQIDYFLGLAPRFRTRRGRGHSLSPAGAQIIPVVTNQAVVAPIG